MPGKRENRKPNSRPAPTSAIFKINIVSVKTSLMYLYHYDNVLCAIGKLRL